MKKLNEILPDVLPEAPGCPQRVALRALTLAARRFLRDTHAWVEEIERFTATEFRTYEVFLEAGRELIEIASVTASDLPIRYSFDIEEHLLTLLDQADGQLVIVKGALQPSEDADEVPDWMVTRYREGLKYGALERLASMRGVEWSDPPRVPEHRAEFRIAVGEARARRNRSHNEQPLAVTPRSFI